MTKITVRNVAEEVRDLPAEVARRNGQSPQNYLLGVSEREARFSRNAELAQLRPVGGGLLSMDEIGDAVQVARGDAPGDDGEGAA